MYRPRVVFFLTAILSIEWAHTEPLRFRAWNYVLPGEQAFYQRLVDDFANNNPGDRVEFSMAPWDKAHDEIAQWLKTDTGPDLIVIPDIWLTEFSPHLDPYADEFDDSFRARFYPVLWRKSIYHGRNYGLVWATSTKALFYRTDLFRQAGLSAPPRTWDELLHCARRLHHPYGPYGLGIPVKPTYESTDNWYFFFWSAGGDFFDANGRAAVDSPIGVASLKFYRDLARRFGVTQPEPTSWSRKECRRYFIEGKLAMHANGPWMVADILKKNPKLPFAIAPLPVAPHRAPFHPRRITQVITDHLALRKNCKQRELALKFIRHAYQRKYRQQFCEMGMTPELLAVGASDFFQRNPHWKIFVDVLPDGKFIPLMKWEPIELAAQQMLYDVFTGRATPESGLRRLAQVMNDTRRAEGKR